MNIKKKFNLIRRSIVSLKWIKSYFNSCTSYKLHLGAGPNKLKGWLNTDIEPLDQEICFLDVSKKLPFQNDIFDYIFAEHLIEHLTFYDGLQLLGECNRVLSPKGRIRLATPDFDKMIGLGIGVKNELQNRYIKWHMDQFFPDIKDCNPIFVINNAFHGWGHQFLYDRKTLEDSLSQSGFRDIIRCLPGESNDINLQKIDFRAQDDMMSYSHLILEGEKPG
jgi:predicted SAM-dependent methyltransferase